MNQHPPTSSSQEQPLRRPVALRRTDNPVLFDQIHRRIIGLDNWDDDSVQQPSVQRPLMQNSQPTVQQSVVQSSVRETALYNEIYQRITGLVDWCYSVITGQPQQAMQELQQVVQGPQQAMQELNMVAQEPQVEERQHFMPEPQIPGIRVEELRQVVQDPQVEEPQVDQSIQEVEHNPEREIVYDILEPLDESVFDDTDSYNQYGGGDEVLDEYDGPPDEYDGTPDDDDDIPVNHVNIPRGETLQYVTDDELELVQHYFHQYASKEGMLTSPRGWIFTYGYFKTLDDNKVPPGDVMAKVFDIKIREALSRANRDIKTTLISVAVIHSNLNKAIFRDSGLYPDINGEWVWNRIAKCITSKKEILNGKLKLTIYMVSPIQPSQPSSSSPSSSST